MTQHPDLTSLITADESLSALEPYPMSFIHGSQYGKQLIDI